LRRTSQNRAIGPGTFRDEICLSTSELHQSALRYRVRVSREKNSFAEMHISLLPAAAVLVLLAGPADALDDSVKEKASLGTSCHGDGGVSQIENTPSLAGNRISSCTVGCFPERLPEKMR
jgi:hypothetical protein